ncbi:porin [Labrys wisconsinensis]|uniref:Porin n=1 Tax=Labrys wisconsinensis TaxID=425677 RepID=A0ABU0JBC2_9HYPH|nr:porin [Labrys wisconsinensis]MDQ0471580.1 hypothetical protein [Labrys wisconsinensis]
MTLKSFLLGAAAGIVTTGAAEAADLPMTKAEPVEYVKVCSEFGEGYFYIPGTDTCLRLQGEIRAKYIFTQPKNTVSETGRNTNATDFSTEARVMWDARTQTEWGLLRSYLQLDIYANNTAANGGRDSFVVDKAFIQLGGFTAGYAHTFFGIYDNDYGDTIFAPYYTSQTTVNLLAYTATFGGGFSATLAVEDNIEHRSSLWDQTGETGGTAGTTGTYGGSRFPDIVGQLRIDQGWGEAAVFAAAHQINYPTGVSSSDTWGWAAGAGVGVKLPFLAGAHLALEGVYADGANNYLGLSDPEAAYDTGTGLENKGKGWSITGELGVDVTPALNVTAFGSYVDYTAGNADDIVLLPTDSDFTAYIAGINATYTIVKGLTVSGEIYYSKKDYKDFGSSVTVDGTTYQGDTDGWNGGIRIRRVF